MPSNPLIVPILNILKQCPEISEYDLIVQLEQNEGVSFPVEHDSYEMALFKKHFITMNALYQLQTELIGVDYYLSITATRINLEVGHGDSVSDSVALVNDGEQKVRDYYLDWTHFDKTSQQDVEKLLNNFWEKYFAIDKQAAAYKVLQLEDTCDWGQVKAQYRKLVGTHHPDKGGDAGHFIEIREAYEVLKQCLCQ